MLDFLCLRNKCKEIEKNKEDQKFVRYVLMLINFKRFVYTFLIITEENSSCLAYMCIKYIRYELVASLVVGRLMLWCLQLFRDWTVYKRRCSVIEYLVVTFIYKLAYFVS